MNRYIETVLKFANKEYKNQFPSHCLIFNRPLVTKTINPCDESNVFCNRCVFSTIYRDSDKTDYVNQTIKILDNYNE